jgi:hypothetical protein
MYLVIETWPLNVCPSLSFTWDGWRGVFFDPLCGFQSGLLDSPFGIELYPIFCELEFFIHVDV